MESRLLRWIACSDFVDLHTQFIDESKAWPENSTFAYWWQTLEDWVLCCIQVRASTTSHVSLHFDGFMVDRNLQPDCSTPDFLDRLAHRLLDVTGFTIPFVVKEHRTFMQMLRSRAPRADRVLLAEHNACLLTYPYTKAFGSATGLWTAAVRSIEIVRRADEDFAVRQWPGAFNGAT